MSEQIDIRLSEGESIVLNDIMTGMDLNKERCVFGLLREPSVTNEEKLGIFEGSENVFHLYNVASGEKHFRRLFSRN